ncbi:MAG: hypothetical protein RI918_1974 [Pseudomonadota bacterium]|jgi:hypothetical protein
MHTLIKNKIVLKKYLTVILACSIGLCVSLKLQAQNLEIRHPWIAESPKLDATAFFTNLKHGDSVKSPFIVQFGMNFWGIAPAGQAGRLTGHHHLLIDTPLPMLHLTPLPFTEKYQHFGKGQMEGLVSLPPGKHTLRLLLADHKHVPHFVFSNEIEINVLPEDSDKEALLKKSNQPELFFININDGASLPSYFKVQFHAAGLNISNKESRLKNTGYFQIQIKQSTGKVEKLEFPSGQTEAWLRVPDGNYKMQLQFVNNPLGDLNSVKGKEISIVISKTNGLQK